MQYLKAPSVDERMIHICNRRAYQSTVPLSTTGSWSDIEGANRWTLNTYSTAMILGDNKVFITNGTEVVAYHNGAGILECGDTNTDPPKAKVGVYFKNRLWLFNTTSMPDGGWYSNALDTLTFDRAVNLFRVESGDATEVKAVIARGDSIFIFKETSIHELVVAGGTAAYWNLRPIETRYGCAAMYCAIENAGVMYYLSFSGIRTLGGQFGEVPMSKLVKTTWDTINWDYIDRSRMIICDNKMYVSVPTGTSTYANTVLVWNLLTEAWTIITGWNVGCWGIFKEYTPTSTKAFEETLMYGDAVNGRVYHVYPASQWNAESAAIDFHIETKGYTFGQSNLYKAGGEFILDVIQGPATADTAMTVSASIDGGSFTDLGTTKATTIYSLDSLGQFKKIKFRIRHNATSTQQVILNGWEVSTYYVPSRV
jgi:hypothetical protein